MASPRRRILLSAATAAAVFGSCLAEAEGVDPSLLVEQIRGTQTQSENAVRVRGFRLRSGIAVVHLDEGVLVPATPVAGRPVEFVFEGTGRITLEAPDEVERDQLELFTGSPELEESFSRAVFVVALDAAADALVGLPAAGDDDRLAEAARILDEWHDRPERKLLGIEARLFMDAIGDPLGAGFFCGYFDGDELGRFLYVADPLDEEQVTLGQFVQVELTERERRQAERHLLRSQRKGRLMGLEVADLGMWDTWVSTSMRGSDGVPLPGTTGVEPLRYVADVTLSGKQLDLTATARVEMQVLINGLRTVNLELSSDLDLEAVTDEEGNDLEYLRTQEEVTVVLPQPATAGDELVVEVRYSGTAFDRVDSGAYVQRETLGWYPHAGTVDRATYDVTIRWPAKFELYGSGRVIEEGRGADGSRWQRRQLERRSLGFSFEVGDYAVARRKVGHIDVSVAIDRLGQKVSRDLAEEVLDAVVEPLSYFEEVFGPYPLDHLEVVSAPRGVSQGLLGFVTLSTAAVVDWSDLGAFLLVEDRRTVIAHEVAHQWWGNVVGWRSYRDQWISEAMANYSALLFARNRLSDAETVWIGPTAGWESELLRSTPGGRSVESLGPVVLGFRLASSLSYDGYRSIVYKKGAVVLDMLARYFREQAFLDIQRDIVAIAADKVVSTDQFLQLVEHFGGTDLSWFSRQYVYGTGLPEIYYNYELREGDEEGWIVEGVARQQAPIEYRYRVVERPNGSLDVRREGAERLDVADSVLVVPFQIGVHSENPAATGRRRNDAVERRFLTGRVLLAGEESAFRFEVDEQPEIVWFDRKSEVFGRFFCESRWPRRITYYQGLDLAAGGRYEEAEATFRDALAAEVASIPENWPELAVDVDFEGRMVDARIQLALARLYLDTDRDVEAAAAFDRAKDIIRREEQWRFQRSLLNVDARLAMRSGDDERAYKMLRRGVFGRDATPSTEGFALLAIAARATDHGSEYRRACARARDRGADLGPLECP